MTFMMFLNFLYYNYCNDKPCLSQVFIAVPDYFHSLYSSGRIGNSVGKHIFKASDTCYQIAFQDTLLSTQLPTPPPKV